MRKATMAGALVLVLAGLLWGGGDPWKTKPVAEWDANDVRKVMNDSPWAKRVQVPAPWKSADSSAVPGTRGGRNPTGGGANPGSGSPSGGRGSSGGGGAMGGAAVGGAAAGGAGAGDDVSSAEAPSASFQVGWSSSRTFRAAAARSLVLGNQMSQVDAEKRALEGVQSYQVAVVGRDMHPFQGLDEDTLKASTFLVAKKSKQKVSPESVHIEVGADGITVQGVTFSFPKTLKTGEATLGAQEKGAEFSTTVTRVTIRASFDIAKMEDKDGRDL
jgi:hypothetical protein